MNFLGLISLVFLLANLSLGKELAVYAIVKGLVKKVHIQEGQKVRSSQLLVEIDPSLYLWEREKLIFDLEAKRLELEKMERDFRRFEELYNRGLLSRSEYEDWRNKYERQKAVYSSVEMELKKLETLISYCGIVSPVDGIVKKVLVREGSFVNGTTYPHLIILISEDR